MDAAASPKHRQISAALERAIAAGEYAAGDRLPSEVDLVARFGVSRPTIARALRDLKDAGLVERRAGSGTYVSEPNAAPTTDRQLFGLLIPDLGATEIFEPICAAIASEVQSAGHGLLWGDLGGGESPADARARRAAETCRAYVEQGVTGVFFAPVEFATEAREINAAILDALAASHTPVVLLDRDAREFAERSDYDVVGIDDFRGGYTIARHLLGAGRERLAYLARPGSAPTVRYRYAGFRAAMRDAALPPDAGPTLACDPNDVASVETFLAEQQPDAIVCANDLTAGELLRTLAELGRRVPEDLAVTGFDDVRYARLFSVPLTTIAQPCRELGVVALETLASRTRRPDLPPRRVLLEPRLVVRRSCGAADARFDASRDASTDDRAARGEGPADT